MKIRPANYDDLEDLERLGQLFTEAAKLPDVDAESLRTTLLNLMNDGVLIVAENGAVQGAIGGLIFPHYWNASEVIAQELFWFVDPEYRKGSTGIKLLVAMENECKQRGAKRLLMLCLDALEGDKIAGIYNRLGYRPQEQTYVKDL